VNNNQILLKEKDYLVFGIRPFVFIQLVIYLNYVVFTEMMQDRKIMIEQLKINKNWIHNLN
jgi:hypothetical protein